MPPTDGNSYEKDNAVPMRASVKMVQSRLSHALSSQLQGTWYASSPLSLPWPWHCLLALGARLYAKGLHRDQRMAALRRRKLPVYVISVGNLVVGGTGKTPLSLELAKHLQNLGWKPAILSRGYKRKEAGPAKVLLKGESSEAVLEFGDEPVLMAHRVKPVPVWVGKDRWAAGKLAIENDDADILILDDGFQHLALERNLDLVLLDALKPLGNGALLPLGPLREPPEHLGRADAVVLTRADNPERTVNTRSRISEWLSGKPVFSCTHRLTGLRAGIDGQRVPLEVLRGENVVAFAGIARPEGFFHLLQQAGIVLSRCLAFPDHHPYQAADLLMLRKAMAEDDTPFLITTEKDMVRLSPQFQAFTLAALLELDFGWQYQAFYDFLQKRLPPRC